MPDFRLLLGGVLNPLGDIGNTRGGVAIGFGVAGAGAAAGGALTDFGEKAGIAYKMIRSESFLRA